MATQSPQLIRCRYSKSKRLRKSSEIKRVLQNSANVKVVTPFFVILGVSSQSQVHQSCEEAPVHRLGIVVTKKVGKAHVRNLLKRQIRESFRTCVLEGDAMDIVVIGRQSAVNAPWDKKTSAIHYALKRLVKNQKRRDNKQN